MSARMRWITFDCFGTLVNWQQGFASAIRPIAGDRTEGLLLRLPVGVVLVDRQYDILFVNSAARRHLGIHTSAIGEDLVHLAQGAISVALRAGIDASFRGQSLSQVVEAAPIDPTSTESRHLELSVHAERLEGEERPIETAIVLVDEPRPILKLVEAHTQVVEQLLIGETDLAGRGHRADQGGDVVEDEPQVGLGGRGRQGDGHGGSSRRPET